MAAEIVAIEHTFARQALIEIGRPVVIPYLPTFTKIADGELRVFGGEGVCSLPWK